MDHSAAEIHKVLVESLKNIQKDDLEYTCRGRFTPKIVSYILYFAKVNLESAGDTNKLMKRIFFIMGEGLQNITRHQMASDKDVHENSSIFAIHKKNGKYFISTGNPIESVEIDILKQKLDKINSLEAEELRQYAREVRRKGRISEKGGAGLGLIEMAKKSGKKLNYDFRDVSSETSFFYLTTEIPTNEEDTQEYNYKIQNIKEYHGFLNNKNVLMFFNGAFNQTNLLKLLTIMEEQLEKSSVTIKIYNIMVEMLQNIVKHGKNLSNNNDWKPGIFFVNKMNGHFVLTAGNYVSKEQSDNIKEKIECFNNMSTEDIQEYRNSILLDIETQDSLSTGLGFTDIIRRSGNKIEYSFHEVENDHFIFVINAKIQSGEAMNPLIIKAEQDTPEVIFNPGENLFEISKRSLPEDPIAFYHPIMQWLDEYFKNPAGKTDVNFKLEYLNSGSTKQIFSLITQIDKYADKTDLTINWYYDKFDEDMLGQGKEFDKNIQTNINFIMEKKDKKPTSGMAKSRDESDSEELQLDKLLKEQEAILNPKGNKGKKSGLFKLMRNFFSQN